MAYYLGVDVGGSHITLDLVDAQTFAVKEDAELRKPLNTHIEPKAVLSVFDEAIREMAAKIGADAIKGVGLAFPGPFNYAEGICRITPAQNKYEQLFGVNFREYLCHALGPDKPVVFNNDAASFAMGEYFKGGAKGYARAVVVTLGTGFGASFIKAGRPQTTGDEVPKDGELWHIPYREGIADDYFSTRWLVAEWKRRTGQDIAGGKEIEDAAKQGDQTAIDIYRTFGSNLAEFVAPWLIRFGAEAFVIGGNIALGWDLFVPAFKAALDPKLAGLAVKPCEMGEQASVCGAALSLTLVEPADVLPGALPAGILPPTADQIGQIAGAKAVLIDGPADFPWKPWILALDQALQTAGKRAVCFNVSAADDGQGGFDVENLANIRADATADLNIVFGAGAFKTPWADAVRISVK